MKLNSLPLWPLLSLLFYRFDALHLLTSQPLGSITTNDLLIITSQVPKPPSLPTQEDDEEDGWSDLPSDSEDLFFMEPNEIQDFLREKKRKKLEMEREKRLEAIEKERGSLEEEERKRKRGNEVGFRLLFAMSLISNQF